MSFVSRPWMFLIRSGTRFWCENTVIGLNFVDIYYRRGTLPVPEFPAIIGDEASGVVEAVGPNVTLVKVGDRVAYADAFGAYTTVRLYPEDRLTVIPME